MIALSNFVMMMMMMMMPIRAMYFSSLLGHLLFFDLVLLYIAFCCAIIKLDIIGCVAIHTNDLAWVVCCPPITFCYN